MNNLWWLKICLLFLLCFSFSCTEPENTQGKMLYTAQCANCHMPDGSGLGSLYPPLNQRERLEMIAEYLPCIIKFGLNDTLYIGSKVFEEEMEPIKGLKPAEMANIINYINDQWGDSKKFYASSWVIEQLKDSCR